MRSAEKKTNGTAQYLPLIVLPTVLQGEEDELALPQYVILLWHDMLSCGDCSSSMDLKTFFLWPTTKNHENQPHHRHTSLSPWDATYTSLNILAGPLLRGSYSVAVRGMKQREHWIPAYTTVRMLTTRGCSGTMIIQVLEVNRLQYHQRWCHWQHVLHITFLSMQVIGTTSG